MLMISLNVALLLSESLLSIQLLYDTGEDSLIKAIFSLVCSSFNQILCQSIIVVSLYIAICSFLLFLFYSLHSAGFLFSETYAHAAD